MDAPGARSASTDNETFPWMSVGENTVVLSDGIGVDAHGDLAGRQECLVLPPPCHVVHATPTSAPVVDLHGDAGGHVVIFPKSASHLYRQNSQKGVLAVLAVPPGKSFLVFWCCGTRCAPVPARPIHPRLVARTVK